jgi:hypothetical protein
MVQIRRHWALVLVVASFLTFPKVAFSQAPVTFDNPTAGPKCTDPRGCAPVDNCQSFASNCGKPAADQFCTGIGFDHATEFHIVPMLRTVIQSNNRICDLPDHCDGFDRIACAPVTITREQCIADCEQAETDCFQTTKQGCVARFTRCLASCPR